METEIQSSCRPTMDQSENEHPELKRKLSQPISTEDNSVELHIDNDKREVEFVKTEHADFAEFAVENGLDLERVVKQVKTFEDFHQSYPGYLENISMAEPCDSPAGDNGQKDSVPCEKENVSQTNEFHELKALMPHADSPLRSSPCPENRSNPVPAHIISATGDSHHGWYEVLEVDENMPQNMTQSGECGLPKRVDKSSLLMTSGSLHITRPTSTPVSTHAYLPPNGFVYTPHPRSGQVLYISDPGGITPEGTQAKTQTVTPVPTKQSNLLTPDSVQQIHPKVLFDSFEENKRPVDEEENNSTGQTSKSNTREGQQKESSAISLLDSPEAVDDERESHNMKERKRRARIKEACDLMRQLVPGMSDKTDKATVFEFAARYIYYLKNFVGNAHDKDFLIKYSPY